MTGLNDCCREALEGKWEEVAEEKQRCDGDHEEGAAAEHELGGQNRGREDGMMAMAMVQGFPKGQEVGEKKSRAP